MDEFSGRCAPIAGRRFSIGKSVNGVDLWVLEVAEAPGQDDGKPNFKYSANMHGDETVGRMLLPALAEWLCANRGADPRAAQLLGGLHLFLIPTMNPDGFDARRRENSNYADLNRDFPDPIKDAGTDLTALSPSREPETRAMMALSLGRPWLAGANFHGGAKVVNYPYDGHPDGSYADNNVPNRSPDDDTFMFISKAYADSHANLKSAAFPQGITNGAEWYPIYGGLQDFDYVVAGCPHVTIEVSMTKYPAASTLPGFWGDNRDALLALPLAALKGVRGFVTSAATGAPLAARLHILKQGAPAGAPYVPFRSGGAHGAFARPLVPGASYTLFAEAPGHEAAQVPCTAPADGGGLVVNVTLAPAR